MKVLRLEKSMGHRSDIVISIGADYVGAWGLESPLGNAMGADLP